MKTRMMLFSMVTGGLIAIAAGAQMAPGPHSGPRKEAQVEKGMMAGGLMQHCQAMVAEHQGMRSRMTAMDGRLDDLVARMNAAVGERKVEAIRAVLEELVAQQRTARGMNTAMEGRMIGHMMEHMRSGPPESVPMCPMMKAMTADEPEAAKKGGHESHH